MMNYFYSTRGYLLLLLLFFVSLSSLATKDSESCPKVKKGIKKLKKCPGSGNYSIANDCRNYLQCGEGSDASPQQTCCPRGEEFDHKERRCMRKGYANCKDICPEEGLVYSDPNNRFGYLKCNKINIPVPIQCPENRCFDNIKEKCKRMGTEGCLNPESEQTEKPSPMSFGRSMRGRSMSGGIGAGCRKPSRQEKGMADTCKATTMFPVGINECVLYIKCYKTGADPTFSCCPPNQFFDHISRRCVMKNQARCKNVCPRKGIKYPNPRSQNSYMECKTRGYPEVQFCPPNKIYRSRLGCIPKTPDRHQRKEIENKQRSEPVEYEIARPAAEGPPPEEIPKEGDVQAGSK